MTPAPIFSFACALLLGWIRHYQSSVCTLFFNYRPQSWEIMHLVASVRLSVRPSGCTQGTLYTTSRLSPYVCPSVWVYPGHIMSVLSCFVCLCVSLYPTVYNLVSLAVSLSIWRVAVDLRARLCRVHQKHNYREVLSKT